jgi:alkylhydroperoxidase/carboxymuconolactone decarboxylase family protein YurZ
MARFIKSRRKTRKSSRTRGLPVVTRELAALALLSSYSIMDGSSMRERERERETMD